MKRVELLWQGKDTSSQGIEAWKGNLRVVEVSETCLLSTHDGEGSQGRNWYGEEMYFGSSFQTSGGVRE